MELSIRALAEAREATQELLEQLELEAYLFEVEPRAGQWQVRVECAHAGGWQTVVMALDGDRLQRSRTHTAERTRLLAEWRERLAACRRKSSGPR